MKWPTPCWFALVALGLAAAGCDDDGDKNAAADAGAPDAGADPALVDPNIADALKSARPAGAGSGVPGDGPPPNGIFAPGGAEKAHASSAPLKLELLDKGSEPRVSLRPPLSLDGKKTFKLQIVRRVQQRPRPNVEYTLRVETEGKKAAGDTSAAAQPAAPQQAPEIVFTVVKAKASERQMGQLPPDADEMLGKLKGTAVRARLGAHGSLTDVKLEVPKEVPQGLGELAGALQEMLPLLFSPCPEEPVGKGAFWLASDRARVEGIDVVRYRHTTVQDIQGDDITLSMNVRAYVADADQLGKLIGNQQGLKPVAFESFGQAELTRAKGALLPSAGQIQVPLGIQVSDNPAQPDRVGEVRIESLAAILESGDGAKPTEGGPEGAPGAPRPDAPPAPPAPAPPPAPAAP